MGKKSKSKKSKPAKKPAHRPVVSGPQLNLPAGVKEGRTPVLRMRYLEAPKKRKGNPFVAVRVPAELHDEWTAWLKRKGKDQPAALRELMAEACGYEGGTEGDDDE